MNGQQSNPRLDAASRLISAAGLAAVLLAVAIIVAVRLLSMAFPAMLNGQDVTGAGLHPNYFRNVFELLSFIATTILGFTSVFALFYAISQTREARNTRLASLYATLEARWASPEMLKSKAMLNEISTEYETQRRLGILPPPTLESIQNFADYFLCQLAVDDYGKYSSAMSLAEYFEYIGMLEKREYLNLEDMEYLIGTVSTEVYSIMSVHIKRLQKSEATRNERNGFINAPPTFKCFDELVGKYGKIFKAP